MHVLQKLPFKKLFLGCWLICGISPVFSQKNYIRAKENINKARYACYLSKWSVADQLYAAKGNKKYLTDTDYYLWAKSALVTGRKDRFYNLLKQSVSGCGMVGHWIKKDKLFFQNYFSSSRIDSFISDYSAKEINCVDTSVQNFCESILAEDQNNRNGRRPNEEIDQMNQEVLLDYIKKNGYPNSNIAGGDYLATVLLHINCSLLEEYLTVLLPEVKKGNLNPFFYAQMHDRIICDCRMGDAKYGAYPQPECPVPTDTIITYRRKIGMSVYLNGPASTPFNLGKPTNFIHDSVIFRKW